MKTLFFTLWLIGCNILSTNAQSDKTVNNKAVDTLDIKKYAGLWYEIARLNHSFEKGLVGVTSEYVIKDDGSIEVLGVAYRDSLSGEKTQIVGKVHIPDKKHPGILRVTYFLFFNADYRILEIEEDYSAALIGSSECDHLWIVSRTPRLPKEKLEDLIKRAQNRGYDTEALLFIPHKKKQNQEEYTKL